MEENETPRWEYTAFHRRLVLAFLIIAPTVVAGTAMHSLLPPKTGGVMNALLTLLFAMLFAWIAFGFWSAVAGLVVTIRGCDRYSLLPGLDRTPTLPERARAAILFPVYNEDTHKVVEEVRTVWRSLKKLGAEKHFDIYILSDSTNPDAWTREEAAWFALRREERAEGAIFYRHRRKNRKGKSGNIADFCRRWGADYPYMIVFDADSLMSGATLVRMVQAMEKNPHVGILQTLPKSINSRTLLSRMQQFSNHLYGPVFAAGLHFWQLGDAQYWGHNAIIRVQPFMRHCHLPTLPGKAPLGGNILSHDFVEAALMRRAGYWVWLAYDLDGSYEENPPSLIDELIRDRRWCQGNLQHSRLLFTKGIFPAHRALFVNGIMSYGSALLWFMFLVASSFQAVMELLVVPVYFPEGFTLFPDWPKFSTDRALALLGITTILLFLPKILTLVMTSLRGAGGFGGSAAMFAAAGIEIVFSALLAPVRMLYHSFFVITTLLGFTVRWNTQNRDDSGTTWSQAVRFHWWGTLLGMFWALALWLLNPGFLYWLSPIVAGLILSIPLSVVTSRPSVGEALLRRKIFLTPVDVHPSEEIVMLHRLLDEERSVDAALPSRRPSGFVGTVVVPKLFALHMALLQRPGKNASTPSPRLSALVEKALREGPGALTPREQALILSTPSSLAELHKRVWLLEDGRARAWGLG